MTGVAGSGSRREEFRSEERAYACRAALEVHDVERRIEATQRVALGVVREGSCVPLPLLAGLPQSEMQLRLVRAVTPVAREQPLHGRELVIAEGVVFKVRKTPVRFRNTRIHLEHRLVRSFTLLPPPEGLVHVADGQAQAYFVRLEPRGVLVSFERFLLPQQPRCDARDRDPGLRVFGLDLQHMAGGGLGLLGATQGEERRTEPPPRQRHVLGLFECMTQQPLGVPGYVSGQRERRKPDQRGEVTRISLQYFAEDEFRLLALLSHQRRGSLLHAPPIRIAEPCALEGDACVVVLSQIHERIAVGKPRAVMVRLLFQHLPHLLARLSGAAAAAARTCKIHARVGEIRGIRNCAFQRRNAL